MHRAISLSFLIIVGGVVQAQCEFVGVSVSASDTAQVNLYHPGFFFFGATPNVGGYDNVCYWTIYDMEGNVLHEAETSGDWETQSFMLFEHDVPVTDSMRVEIVLTSPLEDFDCCVSDTLIWDETQSPSGNSVWGDWSTETDGYTEGVECATSTIEVESKVETIQLYPQPAEEFVRIDGLNEPESFRLFDALGHEWPISPALGSGGSLDVRHLPSGLYFLTIFQRGGPAATKRFIKA